MKAVVYLRTSTTEQNPENQKKECLSFAQNRGYEVLEVLQEEISGFKQLHRPKYERVKELSRKGEVDAVIVWALDRWVRKRDTLLEDVIVLRNYGVKLHSVQEAWLESINIEGSLGKTIQEFLLGLIGSIGELESQRKSERIKIAYANRKKKWGRKSVHTNKKKRIYDLADKGLSYREIAKEEGIAISTISKILRGRVLDRS